jgi:DNA-directed RNA polymerase subunit RPC12/RpoP
MAIKIIRSGTLVYTGFCSRCGCEFSYDLGDLKLSTGNRISCPTCGEYFFHPVQARTLNSFGWANCTNTDPCTECAWHILVMQNGSYTGESPCTWCSKRLETQIQQAYRQKLVLDSMDSSAPFGSDTTCLCSGDIWAQKTSCEECCCDSTEAKIKPLAACGPCGV